MSELPIAEQNDLKSDHIRLNAERMINNPAQMDAFFHNAETQLSSVEKTAGRIDLYAPDVPYTESTVDTQVSYVEAPAYAVEPQSRAQELEKIYFFLDTAGLVKEADDITKVVNAQRHAF